MLSLLRVSAKTSREVFSFPSYWLLALAAAAMMLMAMIALMNYPLLTFAFTSPLYEVGEKLNIAAASLGSFRTNLSVPDQIAAFVNALLAGINVSVIAYYLKKRLALQRVMGVSALGIAGSFIGIGCASCGSVLLVSILGLTSAGGLLRALPLGGLEFGLASVLILAASFLFMSFKLQSSLVCKK